MSFEYPSKYPFKYINLGVKSISLYFSTHPVSLENRPVKKAKYASVGKIKQRERDKDDFP